MNNNENQYTIYIRSTGESVPVTKEEFDLYYHDIDLYRRKQQRHGSCVCPRSRQLTCDMDCLTCPYHRAGDMRSLDYENENEDGEKTSPIDLLPDDAPLLDDIFAEASEIHDLYVRLCELMPEAETIGKLRYDGMPDTRIAQEIGIANTTFRSRIKKVRDILSKEFPDFF